MSASLDHRHLLRSSLLGAPCALALAAATLGCLPARHSPRGLACSESADCGGLSCVQGVCGDPPPSSALGSFNVGDTNIESIDDSALANTLEAFKVTLGQSATLNSLSVYVLTPHGTSNLRVGIYADSSNYPGALQAQTSAVTTTSGWNTISVTPTALNAGSYWLALFTSDNSLHLAATTSTGVCKYQYLTFGAMPSTFPAGGGTSTGTESLYATFADTTAPSTPGTPTATVYSSSQINLSWTASTDNVGVTGYKIYRCSGQSCTTVADTGHTSATNSYSDTGLTASTYYRYKVSAYDAASNNSSQSAISTAAQTQAAQDTTAPSTPGTCSRARLAAVPAHGLLDPKFSEGGRGWPTAKRPSASRSAILRF